MHRAVPVRFTRTPGSARAGWRSYQLLAEILTSYIAGRVDKPAQAALEAGEAWGRYLAGPPAPEDFLALPLPGRDGPLGSPGGAARFGALGVDTPLVASHPPRAE